MSKSISYPDKITVFMTCVYYHKLNNGSTNIDIWQMWKRLADGGSSNGIEGLLTQSLGYFYDDIPERDGVDEKRSVQAIIDFDDGAIIEWYWVKESKSGEWVIVTDPSPPWSKEARDE